MRKYKKRAKDLVQLQIEAIITSPKRRAMDSANNLSGNKNKNEKTKKNKNPRRKERKILENHNLSFLLIDE